MKMKNLLESLCFGDFFEYLISGFPFLELERRGEEHLGFKKRVFVIVFNEFFFQLFIYGRALVSAAFHAFES